MKSSNILNKFLITTSLITSLSMSEGLYNNLSAQIGNPHLKNTKTWVNYHGNEINLDIYKHELFLSIPNPKHREEFREIRNDRQASKDWAEYAEVPGEMQNDTNITNYRKACIVILVFDTAQETTFYKVADEEIAKNKYANFIKKQCIKSLKIGIQSKRVKEEGDKAKEEGDKAKEEGDKAKEEGDKVANINKQLEGMIKILKTMPKEKK